MINCIMNPIQSIITCIIKVKSTSGRAKRSEFWWFALFAFLYALFSNYCSREYPFTHPVSMSNTVISLITEIALTSAITRRLHDIGKSGWSQLIIFTIIGIPMVMCWLTFPSEKSDNQYGRYDSDDMPQYRQEPLNDAEILYEYNNDFYDAQKQKSVEHSTPLLLKKTQRTQKILSFGKRSRSVIHRKIQ